MLPLPNIGRGILAAIWQPRRVRLKQPAIDATLSAAPTPGSSWARTKRPFTALREKRGEGAPVDLSAVLIVQLGLVTEDLNRRWCELNSGHRVTDVQRHAVHKTIPWMAATSDRLVKEADAVFEAKLMLPWSFSEEAVAEMSRGIRAKRSKSGAVSFDLVEMEVSHASVQ
jgi:hypothetical protein